MSVAAAVGHGLHDPRGRDRRVARHPAPAAGRGRRCRNYRHDEDVVPQTDGAPDAVERGRDGPARGPARVARTPSQAHDIRRLHRDGGAAGARRRRVQPGGGRPCSGRPAPTAVTLQFQATRDPAIVRIVRRRSDRRPRCRCGSSTCSWTCRPCPRGPGISTESTRLTIETMIAAQHAVPKFAIRRPQPVASVIHAVSMSMSALTMMREQAEREDVQRDRQERDDRLDDRVDDAEHQRDQQDDASCCQPGVGADDRQPGQHQRARTRSRRR